MAGISVEELLRMRQKTSAPKKPSSFEPSVQQQVIFDELAKGLEFCELPFFNMVVDAKAGSGKTTTIVEGMRYIPREGLIPPRVVFLAFNKSIADTWSRKCPPGVMCSTFHSLGRRALVGSGLVERSVKLDTNKARKLVWNAISDRDDPDTRNICRLVSMCKTVPVDVREIDLDSMCYHHDITLERKERAFNIVRQVVETTLADTSCIDFDDMLYMPVMYNISFDHYNYVFVDEAQDTNNIQLEILSRLTAPRSRLVAVGDPHQAIYGFRGANADSMSRIVERFQCKTYPLSVSYRCPKAVVREAQRYLTTMK
jgi:superfamily I DNA/RNA helicase